MRTALLVALAVLGLGLWAGRPYSVDLLRYGLWRVTVGRAFVGGVVASEGARIAWRSIGPLEPGRAPPDAPPLLLLHGGFGSDLDWYAEIPTLARHHALLLVDSRGHGGSTLGELPLSYALLARDALAVLDALGHPRVDLLGWSDGGNTGLTLARLHPERLAHLVAISANASPAGLVPRLRRSIERGEVESSRVSRVLRALHSPEPGRRLELDDRVGSLWRSYPQLDAEDLRAIVTPTLIIAGSEDDVLRRHLEEITGTLPDARLVVLPGIGHDVPQAAPARVLALVEAFLRPAD